MLVQETGAPGWAEVVLPGVEARILVKIAKVEGRWVVSRLFVIGDAVDSGVLRAIPMTQIESLLNTPGVGKTLDAQPTFTSKWHRSFEDELHQVDEALQAYLDQRTPGSPYLAGEPPTRIPLTRPDGSDPDGFYRKVAEAYNAVVVSTSAPAKTLAEEAGVPTTTVHRWILEARRRGFLPPARKGRAG